MALWLLLWSTVLSEGREVTASALFEDTVDRIGDAILIVLGVRTTAGA